MFSNKQQEHSSYTHQYLTHNTLSSVFSQDDITKIIQNLSLNKVDHNNSISIRILKFGGPAIFKPLGIIFSQYYNTGISSPQLKNSWKNNNDKNLEMINNWVFNEKWNLTQMAVFRRLINFFKNTFFPSAIIKWNKLGPTIWNPQSFDIFKNNIRKYIRLTLRSFQMLKTKKYIPMTRLGLR